MLLLLSTHLYCTNQKGKTQKIKNKKKIKKNTTRLDWKLEPFARLVNLGLIMNGPPTPSFNGKLGGLI